jgi:hypothetical protein
MTRDAEAQLTRRFLSVLSAPDDLVLSGIERHLRRGSRVASVMRRARTIAEHWVHAEIIQPIYGYSGVAILLHNTGEKNGVVLDQHLAAVFSFRDDKIARLDTFLSDVPMVEVFFG